MIDHDVHEELVYWEACPKALDWLKAQESIAAAWNNCRRPGWMLWILDHHPLLQPLKMRVFLHLTADYISQFSEINAVLAQYRRFPDQAEAVRHHALLQGATRNRMEAADWHVFNLVCHDFWLSQQDQDNPDYLAKHDADMIRSVVSAEEIQQIWDTN